MLVFDRAYDDATARLADLGQLAALAAEYGTRSRFLTEITLDPPASTSDLAGPPHLDDDYLILSTIHSAKGGEWDAVFVIHAADGNIPSDMAISDPGGLEEERRLLYVALTRARDHLHVTVPQRFYHKRFSWSPEHSYALPSRFLDPAMEYFEQVTAAPPHTRRRDRSPAGRCRSGRRRARGSLAVGLFLEEFDGRVAGVDLCRGFYATSVRTSVSMPDQYVPAPNAGVTRSDPRDSGFEKM